MSNKGGININISGGSTDFGNIVQGDNNTIHSKKNNVISQFHSEIAELLKMGKATQDQVDCLTRDVNSILQSAGDKDVFDRAKELYQKYSWAIEPLKKLFSIFLP